MPALGPDRIIGLVIAEIAILDARVIGRRDAIGLDLETQVLQSWNDRDGLVRPKVVFEWRDDTTLSLGFDFFYGDHNGVFGQYDSNDRLWMQVRFSR